MEESARFNPFQNSDRPPATTRFKVGVAVVAVAAVLGIGYLMHRSATNAGGKPLSQAERAELVERSTVDGKFLVHPELGFRFRHPGELYFASADAAEKLAKQFDDPSTRFYAFAEMKSGNMLYVTVSKRAGLDADAFTEMVDTITHVFTQQTLTRFGEDVKVDNVERTFDHARGRATVYQLLGEGRGHIRIGVWKSTFGRTDEYVVVLAAVSMRSDTLAPVLDSFSLR